MVQTWVARPESSKGVLSELCSLLTPFEDSGRATRKSAFLNHARIVPFGPVRFLIPRHTMLRNLTLALLLTSGSWSSVWAADFKVFPGEVLLT